ncbi:Large ribosomal subunit protein mL40 [Nakaseomyces bracarensis]|uniref:Large ribosomal subunit protein mL40 n=1 Tax=Nakaseomyces bracarensis TaxID=273131 RepID=A0ABR4NRC2_9SACH
MLRSGIINIKIPQQTAKVSTTFVRGKRTKAQGSLSPLAQRVVTQLSVLSASRKQPKLLKLSKEDLIKHQTIEKAWSLYKQQKRIKQVNQLQAQYKAMEEAMETLKKVSPELYEEANVSEQGKLFPLDMKVTTDYPPNKIWHYKFKK